MNKKKLYYVFDLIKKETHMDYAIINTDDYGDCNTCVTDALIDTFGIDSKGIYLKHWTKGMNANGRISKLKGVRIAHNITEEQGEKMITIFKANGYRIEPKKLDYSLSFTIEETDAIDN